MTNKNFLALVQNVGSNIQDTSSAMQTIIKRYVNDTYFDVLKRINWEATNYDYSFSAAQDTVLPSDFGKEIAIYDNTNKIVLTRTTQKLEIEDYVSSIADSGSLAKYAIIQSAVNKQPTSAAVVSLSSSSAVDTTQTVFIRGVSDGVEKDETVTLTGTVAATSANSYSRIITIGKSAVTVGKVTGTIGSDTICVMSQEQLTYSVKLVRFYPSPTSAWTVNMPYIINPLPMTSDYDAPIFDCADAVELGATSKALMYKRQYAKATSYKGLYEQEINNLIWDKENQPNELHVFNITSYDRDNV